MLLPTVYLNDAKTIDNGLGLALSCDPNLDQYALLFCAVLVSVASGLQPQLRFMNAQFNNNTITLTTSPYNITNAVSLFGSYYGFPSTYYTTLPSPIYGSLNVPQTFYATQGYGNARANVTATLNDTQSYSFVYVAQSNPQFFDTDIGGYVPTTNFPIARLFAFEETPSYVGTVLKIVNTAVSSYSYGFLQVSCSFYGTYDVPFGGSTDFIDVLPNEYIELVFFSPNSNKNVTTWIYTANATSSVVYLRGDVSSPFDLTFDVTSIFLDDQQPSYPPVHPQEPVAAPIGAPNNGLPWPRVRFLDSATPNNLSVLAVFDQNYNLLYNNTAMWKSEYQYIYQGAGNYYLAFTSQLIAGSWLYYLRPGQSVTVLQTAFSGVQFVNDYPENYTASFSYIQVVYNVKDYYATAWCTLSTPSWVNQNFLGYFSIWGFNQVDAGWSNIQCQIGDSTVSTNVFISSGVATTIYIFGESYAPYFFVDSQALPVVEPVCVNGYLESNGICNCYSGYFTDGSSPYKCAGSNYYCSWNNQSDALSNDYIPYINWWNNPYVYGDQLYFTITSDLVSGRRTLVELPNAQCNFLNQPQYFQKINGGCHDVINVQIPYIDCGFTKISTPYEDFYKGTVHVKQIDRVTVGGVTTDRVIDTPFPISIRMPKQLAVESSVQVFGPPSLAIDAAFVGQTMNTDTQSGNLQYVSAVQYPLQIEQVQLVDLPYGVYAWVELVNVNCSAFGPCVQRLELHINTTNCYISGTYRMVVSLSCRSDQGCPDEAKNGTQAFIESRIVSQSLCSEVGVDIDLNGYIQAFTDASFSSVALAFYPGQSAYFMINAYSSRVSLSSVRLESVYYYGPNINYQYLYVNGNTTDIASSSNFVSSSRGNSQAWFGVDVSVSTPQSGDNTLFKLYQGQNGVYNFVAIVDVEWSVNTSSSVAPVGPPVEVNQPVESNVPFSFKKRMALQGSVLNQGSQFTAQVQIAGPTPSSQQPPQQQQPQSQQTPVSSSIPDDKPVSSGVSLVASWLAIGIAVVML